MNDSVSALNYSVSPVDSVSIIHVSVSKMKYSVMTINYLVFTVNSLGSTMNDSVPWFIQYLL